MDRVMHQFQRKYIFDFQAFHNDAIELLNMLSRFSNTRYAIRIPLQQLKTVIEEDSDIKKYDIK